MYLPRIRRPFKRIRAPHPSARHPGWPYGPILISSRVRRPEGVNGSVWPSQDSRSETCGGLP